MEELIEVLAKEFSIKDANNLKIIRKTQSFGFLKANLMTIPEYLTCNMNELHLLEGTILYIEEKDEENPELMKWQEEFEKENNRFKYFHFIK